MSVKMKYHSKWNSTEKNVTQNKMSFKLECHSNWNFTQVGMSLQFECHSNLNVTQIGESFKVEKTSRNASLLSRKAVFITHCA